jgi:hypothetical protein
MISIRRKTGNVRASRVRGTRSFGVALLAILAWLLPSLANSAIVHEETLTYDSLEAFVSSASVTGIGGGTDQLYVAAIATYDFSGASTTVSSISGGGLTWTLQKSQCSRRLPRANVEIWQAFGSPGASFNADITLVGETAVTSATVSRYSGADPTTPTEGADGSNTGGVGVNAVCDELDEETLNLSLSLTSSNNDSVLFVASHPRNKTISAADVDYTQRAVIQNANGGSGAYLYVHDRTLAAAGTDSADHTIGSVTGWDMAGLVINPASSGGGTCPINVSIADITDDAEEDTTDGSMYLGSSDLELIYDNPANQEIGLRFLGLTLNQGATITSAYVEFTAKSTISGAGTNLTFHAQDIGTAATFTTGTSNISGRDKTNNSVDWMDRWCGIPESRY